jgi:hypothetical protein
MLKWLDTGSDTISVNFARGHGSKTSIFLTLLFIAGFIAFLILFKMFQLTATVANYDLVTDPITYSFATNEIMFATMESSEILVSLIDENYNVISNLSLVSSPDCLVGLTQDQVSKLT